jgi:hypothetical protein
MTWPKSESGVISPKIRSASLMGSVSLGDIARGMIVLSTTDFNF